MCGINFLSGDRLLPLVGGPSLWDDWSDVEPSGTRPPWDARLGSPYQTKGQWTHVPNGEWEGLLCVPLLGILDGDAAHFLDGQTGMKRSHVRMSFTVGNLPRHERNTNHGHYPLGVYRPHISEAMAIEAQLGVSVRYPTV